MRDYQATSDLFGAVKPKQPSFADLRRKAYAAGVKDAKHGEWDGTRFLRSLHSDYNAGYHAAKDGRV